MNFNIQDKADYSLNVSLIDESIRLYGTEVKFVFADKIVDGGVHGDDIAEAAVFNDFKTLKTNEWTSDYSIWVMLAEPEGYPSGLAFAFNNFGLINDDTMQVYVSINSFDFLQNERGEVHPKEIISNLIVFPNGKVLEITNCQVHVPGVNNTFVYGNKPSCYLLSLKSYNFDRSAVDLARPNKESFPNINDFFAVQESKADLVKNVAEKEVLVVDSTRDTIKRDKIDDVFGNY